MTIIHARHSGDGANNAGFVLLFKNALGSRLWSMWTMLKATLPCYIPPITKQHIYLGKQTMKYVLILMGMLAVPFSAIAEDTMMTQASKYGFNDTQARLEAALEEKGLTLFAKIDHAAGAKKAGLKMQPATVTIFGNPKGGTPFMVASPEAAIDFPLKALLWEDADGKVFFSYNTVSAIVARHHIKGQDELAKKLDGLLAAIAKSATD